MIINAHNQTRGFLVMDHDVVVRGKMTEKYVLDELDPKLRDEFEEHFFDCPECALDVRAAIDFVEHSKVVLAQESMAQVAEIKPVRAPERPAENSTLGWFAWLRPAVAVPVFALLLAVIAYQNLITLPQLAQSTNRAQLLPATTLNLQTYGEPTALAVHPGEGFLVNLIVPPGQRYDLYKVDLKSPSGSVESLPISASPDDTWPIRFPAGNRVSGLYKLTVYGITSSSPGGDGDKEVGSSSFQLRIRKTNDN